MVRRKARARRGIIPLALGDRVAASVPIGENYSIPGADCQVASPSMEVALGGAFAVLRGVGSAVGGGVRGVVQGFSAASRRRLLDLVNSINRGGSLPLFVTLTYPAVWSGDWQVWKRDLRAFGLRVRRAFPGASMVWRMDFQVRGAPHFHLLVFGVPLLPKQWVSRVWFEIVGSGDPRHLLAGTQVARVRSWGGVVSYVAKYMGKEAFDKRAAGRVWGVMGRDKLPIEMLTIHVTWAEFYRLRRVLRGWLRARLGRRVGWGRRPGSGLRVYLDSRVMIRLLTAMATGP
jgi:hypothetical protein